MSRPEPLRNRGPTSPCDACTQDRHQRVVGNLLAALHKHVRKYQLGEVFVAPVDVVFSSATVLEPDLLFLSRPRAHIITERNVSGPPDFVVEVTSESSALHEREIKPKQYAHYGVPEFWLIDPDGKSVEIFRLKEGACELAARLGFGDALTSPLLPGLSQPVSSLWEGQTTN